MITMKVLIVSFLLLVVSESVSSSACSYLRDKYLVNVFENSPIGTKIPIFIKTAQMAADTFSIVDQSNTPFPFDLLITTNFTFNVTSDLDRETVFVYTCAIRCVSPTLGETKVPIFISIDDIDDVSPVWTSPTGYEVKVNEGAPAGTEVTQVGSRPQITDGDSSASQRLEIRIVSGPYSNFIRLQSFATTTPVILTNKIFDYEAKSSYDIELTFLDYEISTGRLAFNGTTNLTLKVIDLEDEPPKWEHNKYTTVVDSNPTRGRLLSFQPADLKAYDGDTVINATILYSLPAGVSSIVDVNQTTAELTLNQDNPTPQVYQFYVKAYQADRPQRETLVLVQIDVKASTVHPLCRSPIVQHSIPEDTPVNSNIVAIDINYPLNSAALTYSVLTHATVFSVSGGWLKLLQKLDYETNLKLYNVSIRVTDGTQPATCYFEIAVTNVNDNSPEFAADNYDFKPTSRGKDITVGTVQASDKDGDSLTYSVKQTNLFSIDQTSGVIKQNSSSELYVADTYSFLIVAKDNSRNGQALVKVTFPNSTAAANSLVVAMATLGALLVMVLVVAAIVFFLYRKRFQKQIPHSTTPDKAAVNRYFFENHTTADQAEAAWTNVPSPLEAMYKDTYCTKEPGAATDPDGANDCINYGTEYGGGGGTHHGSIRSVSGLSNATSAACRRMALAMESRPSPAELSEVEGSIESYSIAHDETPRPSTSQQLRGQSYTAHM